MPTEKQKIPGLVLREKTWWIDKKFRGQRICESCRTSDYNQALDYFAFRLNQVREAKTYGVRPKRTFMSAATKYLNETVLKSLPDYAMNLKIIMPFIGDLYIDQIHMGTAGIQQYLKIRRKEGLKARTINKPLQVVRLILNLACNEWIDENGLSWLEKAPRIKLLPQKDAREPYPISWYEQERLMACLPDHLKERALFVLNTGLRDQELCNLRWDFECEVPEINESVFIIPKELIKNFEDRVVVLNLTAHEIIDRQRGKHCEYVFTYKGKPISRFGSSAWYRAIDKAGLGHVRPHDLRHTFARRLRAAGVSFEDRQDLLGHKSGRVTTHYSQAELLNLITATNKIVQVLGSRKSPTMAILRKKPLRVVNA
ncbi:MAG: tyrosine-type recombinase/integrase [Desulfomonilaceae bacterium]